jgi:hypothetical protein
MQCDGAMLRSACVKVENTKKTQYAEYEVEFYDGFGQGYLDRTK